MISVIVPIYKVEPYLRQCVDSILGQTYQNIEVLLIDDGSPDRCGEICDEYAEKDDRVRVFHTENRGLSAARNLGLREAKGEYIGFVDSDDWIELDMYEVLLRRMQETEADIGACGLWFENGSLSHPSRFNADIYEGTASIKAMLDRKISNHAWNKLYRRTVFAAVSFPNGCNYEDIATMHRLLNEARIVAVIPDHEYHYRQRTDCITKNHSAKNLIAYADAYMDRYSFLKAVQPSVFSEKNVEITYATAVGISRLWRWWYGCLKNEKREYENRIIELVNFSRTNYPLFGYHTWPAYLRVSAAFMRSKSVASFALLYWLNSVFRWMRGQEPSL